MVLKKQRIKGHAVEKRTGDELLASRERMTRASIEFLKIDIQTALTFLEIARQTDNEERKRRNIQSAGKAYDTVLRFVDRVQLGTDDLQTINTGLERLRSELEEFGEVP